MLLFPCLRGINNLTQYCSVKTIVKPETLVETLHVTSLHSLTEQYWNLTPSLQGKGNKKIKFYRCDNRVDWIFNNLFKTYFLLVSLTHERVGTLINFYAYYAEVAPEGARLDIGYESSSSPYKAKVS
jgi:hypothetical protein